MENQILNIMKNKQITIDFDSTLTRKDVQKYAKNLISRGIDVWVLTSRYDTLSLPRWVNYDTTNQNDDLWKVVDSIGIPRWKVRFTCMEPKGDYLEKTKVLWHLDDDEVELEIIEDLKMKTVGIQVNDNNWLTECEKYLNNE